MLKTQAKKGLVNGRIAWNKKENLSYASMIAYGFSAKFISKKTGLTTGQIYHRNFLKGISPKTYRDGNNRQAQMVVLKLKIV